jgi:two-component system CheB/CheR fusion protein
VPISSGPPRSGLLVDGGEFSRDFARELQVDDDELRESNRQFITAMEEVQSLNVTLQSVNEALHTTNVELRTELEQSRSRAGDLEKMLNGIGIAVVLLSEDLELREYNAAASRFFALKRQDIGRSIARVRHDFVQTSIVALCREVLDSGDPLERIANVTSGDLVSLRVREVEFGASAPALLLTVTEFTDLGLEPKTNFA